MSGDIPDPKTSLTPNEKKAIRDTWEAIYANKKENGIALLLRLFEDFPETKARFKNLKEGDDMKKLAQQAQFKAHVLRVMAALNSLIENLDDADILVELLINLGRSHNKHKVKPSDFNKLGGAAIWMVETKSGSSYSEFAKGAWVKAYGVITSIIVKELDPEEQTAE